MPHDIHPNITQVISEYVDLLQQTKNPVEAVCLLSHGPGEDENGNPLQGVEGVVCVTGADDSFRTGSLMQFVCMVTDALWDGMREALKDNHPEITEEEVVAYFCHEMQGMMNRILASKVDVGTMERGIMLHNKEGMRALKSKGRDLLDGDNDE